MADHFLEIVNHKKYENTGLVFLGEKIAKLSVVFKNVSNYSKYDVVCDIKFELSMFRRTTVTGKHALEMDPKVSSKYNRSSGLNTKRKNKTFEF